MQMYVDTLRKYIPKAAPINLQHTPLSIHCLGIFTSHTVDVFLLKLQFSSLICWSLQLSSCFLELLRTLGSFCTIIPLLLSFLPVSPPWTPPPPLSPSLFESSRLFYLSTSGLAESSSLPVNVDSLFSLNTHGRETPWPIIQQINSLSIYCYINVYECSQTSEVKRQSLRALINSP